MNAHSQFPKDELHSSQISSDWTCNTHQAYKASTHYFIYIHMKKTVLLSIWLLEGSLGLLVAFPALLRQYRFDILLNMVCGSTTLKTTRNHCY